MTNSEHHPVPITPPLVVLVTGAGSGIGRAVAEMLAHAGHIVYASLRAVESEDRGRAEDLRQWAKRTGTELHTTELDVLSEPSCRAAVDQILLKQGRLDVVVNNAGMLMSGLSEAFGPDQFLQVLDTNAVSWLRVNRAALPAMRRQGRGVLVYIGSTTTSIHEPFIGPYVASKAAGDALAEAMGFEVSRFGVETVIVMPGAFTSGTEHFAHAHAPSGIAVTAQYGDLPALAASMGGRLEQVNAAHAAPGTAPLGVEAVGTAVRDVLALPHGQRPTRIVIDPQHKGVEDLNALHRERQTQFFRELGIDDLMQLPAEQP